MTKNFKAETLRAIGDSKALWVSDGKHVESFESFIQRCDFSYDAGYGIEVVSTKLVIMLDDGSWLTRQEYDGAEWWERRRAPQRPDEQGTVEVLARPERTEVSSLEEPECVWSC